MDDKKCPESKDSLGHKTWVLLHSIAAHFPLTPTEKTKQSYKDFFETFPYIYPSYSCAKDFQELMSSTPPETESRESLQLWLCKVHNIINKKLNKQEFSCKIKDLELRWRKGPPECYPEQADDIDENNIVF
ncbi:unnamed protein product [Blepharisma stoltei]|uniref:Sulfhydryl oxidase n=1 Tax=Blepharisma stoltei TaxID=1481888 RepID=A0AAU9IWJ8_9CILI|nr:unnamed protein product [Blepharisma stoltei]